MVMESAGYEPRNCWAPEMLYDEANDCYLIFWASTIKVGGEWRVEEGKKYDNRIYYTTTRDFEHFAPARLLFDYGYNVIDATAVLGVAVVLLPAAVGSATDILLPWMVGSISISSCQVFGISSPSSSSTSLR